MMPDRQTEPERGVPAIGGLTAAAPPRLAPRSLTSEPVPALVDGDEPTCRFRLLIVDDAASTRRFLRAVLEDCPRLEVVGEADNGSTGVEMAEELQPDVVLLDVSMPGLDGYGALSGLQRVAPGAKVIVLSGMDASVATSLLDSGATAFVPKGLPPWDLLERLETILGRPIVMAKQNATDQASDVKPADHTSAMTSTRPGADLLGYDGVLRVGARVTPEVRAVVCDNVSLTRHLITQVLESCGVVVTAEVSGFPPLLAVVGILQPNLVVLDPYIQGETAGDILADLRRESPATAVIAYSAMKEHKNKALAGGAGAFVARPHIGQLADRVGELANRIRQLVPSFQT
jgi:CheY-like chemotaxis protein